MIIRLYHRSEISKEFERKNCDFLSVPSVHTYDLAAQNNGLSETVLLSRNNLCFG